jgi:5-(carboxyamino)imidazole ribonucleotide synthase
LPTNRSWRPTTILRAIGELGARSDVVTYEFENIALESVRALESDGRLVRPKRARSAHRAGPHPREDVSSATIGLPVAPFAPVLDERQLDEAMRSIDFPAVLKTARGGYDGKGQWVAHSAGEARAAVAAARGVPLIFERFVPFELEVSVICARGSDGDAISFPVTENQHDHGVLATTIVPARISRALEREVREIALRVGEKLEIVGAYCVEFFVVDGGAYVNEIAPRVHNSGHYSLDATSISQYEAHVRAICDLPLVEPRLFAPAVMVNILGTGKGDHLEGIADLLRDPDLKLHIYGKRHAALRRKMGHFTVVDPRLETALAKAETGRALLSWTPTRPLQTAPV